MTRISDVDDLLINYIFKPEDEITCNGQWLQTQLREYQKAANQLKSLSTALEQQVQLAAHYKAKLESLQFRQEYSKGFYLDVKGTTGIFDTKC